MSNNNCSGVPPCNYSTLGTYVKRTHSIRAPLPAGTQTGYIVPNYKPLGYNALSHGQSVPSCSGYFNIYSAYGQGSGSCNTTYSTRLCGGL